ncbi:effector-associated constant component EACC1 [Nocardia sp. CDC160]|uniref:effector-associated constant component EACC1 n=1 Tax=Nocardia sp. CDC160 TaxID=3112166 RepID=UPI002DBA75ED|nr:hypothetical protein [Nocardia sp. CDC160]MEC3919432.1 hypothetical protein [Nocardia sp. CDC160]
MSTTIIISISDAEDDVAELGSLFNAIVDDDDLRSVRKQLVGGESVAGTLGAEEIIKLVVESAPLMAAVTACVNAWLSSRRTKFTLKIGQNEISVNGKVSEDLVRQALEQIKSDALPAPQAPDALPAPDAHPAPQARLEPDGESADAAPRQ